MQREVVIDRLNRLTAAALRQQVRLPTYSFQLLIGAAQEIEVNPFAVAPVKVAAGQGGEVPAQGSVPLLSPR